MRVLVGREAKIFAAFADALVGASCIPAERLARRVREMLARSTLTARIFFRAALLLFEWGTLLLRTGSGRFEHFTRLPVRVKARYLHLWMHHKCALVRQVFLFLRLVALAAYYDDREEAGRLGYVPRWLS
ncbi:MAG: hypothetical protein HY716_07105 [Planctomycetes bacterium]|nr:hypothetical protein [Planctomycetota bacterium]